MQQLYPMEWYGMGNWACFIHRVR